MRFFTARSLVLATLVPALGLFVVVPGCAKQSEGERCGDSIGVEDDDCGDGLKCFSKDQLLNGNTDLANRCCYSDGHVTDSRCEPRDNGPAAVAGAGGGGGSSAGGGAAGDSSAQAGEGA
jgi:hypothetical protein